MHALRIASVTAAFVLAAALSGCGSDNPVASGSLDSSAPAPPSNLRFSGSLLTWDPSPDADVIGYEVEADLPDPQVAYVRVSGNPPTALTAFDLQTFQADYLNTWYRVRAVDVGGNRSQPSNSVYVSWNPQSAGAPMPPDAPSIVEGGPINP